LVNKPLNTDLQNKCVKYWPDEKEPREMDVFKGTLKVTNVSENTTHDHVLREFDVSFQNKVSVNTWHVTVM